MATDSTNPLTLLPIISEEQAREDFKYCDSITEYDDAEKARGIIEDYSYSPGTICLYSSKRESQTEYVSRVYRIGESKWIYVFNIQFLD